MKFGDESGQVLPMVTVMALGLLAMVGLVIDAGVLFASRRDLQATADAAARAGATVIDEDAYRRSGGRSAVLDPDAAAAATISRVDGVDVLELGASRSAVFIRIARRQELLLLGLIGVGPVQVEAYSTARPKTGILAPGG